MAENITGVGALSRRDFLTGSAAVSYTHLPYVRFQSLSSDQKDAIGAIAERHGVAVSSLSSLWMPFVLHSVSFLKPGGRLGLVLPAELLTVNYAAPLRSFLMASFSSVRLATFDEPVFPEVQEEVVLLPVSYTHLDVYKRQLLCGAVPHDEEPAVRHLLAHLPGSCACLLYTSRCV